MKLSPIRIILDHSTTARAFEKDEMIHQHEFEKACGLIDKQIEKANQLWDKDNAEPQITCSLLHTAANLNAGLYRQHETISIFGNRGTGKTSFLYSILAEYRTDPVMRQVVETFDIIDPTLIEEKGHFFLLLVSLVNEKVDKVLRRKECLSDRDAGGVSSLRKEWETHLDKLAGGIPSLDGVGMSMENISWQDKTYIMEKGLDDVGAAFHLEEYFQDLVKLALKILGKKVFLIAFDDIDVDFKKGWPVLEVIRKYLTTPYIITLLSGNMKLYAQNIRKQQWRNFGRELSDNEAKDPAGHEEYSTLVNEIEGQYLLKILKAANRIHLRSLYETFQIYGSECSVTVSSDETKEESLQERYKEILAGYGIRNLYQMDAYRTYLMTLSLRTQVHFLRLHSKGIPEDIGCIEVFLSRMYARNIDVDLANNMPRKLAIVILRFLLREKIVSAAYQLQPTLENMDVNTCLMGLSVLFSQKVMRNPFLVFEYLIKIGCIRNFSTAFDYEGTDESEKYTINGLCRHAGFLQEKGLNDIMGDSMAYAEAAERQAALSLFGCFKLLGLEEKARVRLTNRIDSVFKNRPLEEQVMGYMPLCSLQSGHKDESRLYYSVYALLAAIGELVYVAQTGGDMVGALVGYAHVRTFRIPSEYGKSQSDDGPFNERDDKPDNDSSDDHSTDLSNLSKSITEWVKSYDKVGPNALSPHLLGKISTRFFHATDHIRTSSQSWKPGELMHRCIIALMNAALTEETIENYQTGKKGKESLDKLRLNNAIQKDSVFLANLQFIDRNKAWDCVPLSKWLFTCPLLVAYLNFDSMKEFDVFKSVPETCKGGKLFESLNHVLRPEHSKGGRFFYGERNMDKIKPILKENGISYQSFIQEDDNMITKKELEKVYSMALESDIENFKTYLVNHPEETW